MKGQQRGDRAPITHANHTNRLQATTPVRQATWKSVYNDIGFVFHTHVWHGRAVDRTYAYVEFMTTAEELSGVAAISSSASLYVEKLLLTVLIRFAGWESDSSPS